eukprot:scaffold8371_cov66-Phaeocystis_antarctica.AAC.2
MEATAYYHLDYRHTLDRVARQPPCVHLAHAHLRFALRVLPALAHEHPLGACACGGALVLAPVIAAAVEAAGQVEYGHPPHGRYAEAEAREARLAAAAGRDARQIGKDRDDPRRVDEATRASHPFEAIPVGSEALARSVAHELEALEVRRRQAAQGLEPRHERRHLALRYDAVGARAILGDVGRACGVVGLHAVAQPGAGGLPEQPRALAALKESVSSPHVRRGMERPQAGEGEVDRVEAAGGRAGGVGRPRPLACGGVGRRVGRHVGWLAGQWLVHARARAPVGKFQGRQWTGVEIGETNDRNHYPSFRPSIPR